MSVTRDIGPFERTKPIDCDYIEFWRVFGDMKSHLYTKHRYPKKTHKDHVKRMDNAVVFEQVLGYPPPVKTILKKNAECRLQFPLIVFFNQVDSVVQMDMKYRVYNKTTGHEIVKLRAKTTQAQSSRAIKALSSLNK